MRPIFAVSRRFREPGLRKRFSSAPCRDVSLARRTGRVEQLAAGNNDTIDSEDFELRLQQRRRGQ